MVTHRLKIYFAFPHIYVAILIFIIALIALSISLSAYHADNDLLFSISSNIFAGLLTGLIICLIGCVKQIFITQLQRKKAFISELQKLLNEYFQLRNELTQMSFQSFNNSEELFSFIYDTGAHANWVNEFIIQSCFNKNPPIRSIEYCKEHFDYDALALEDVYADLHMNLYESDIQHQTKKQVLSYFSEADKQLRKLNSMVQQELSNIDSLIQSV